MMMLYRFMLVAGFVLILVLSTACAGSTPAPTAPPQPPAPATASTQAAASTTAPTQAAAVSVAPTQVAVATTAPTKAATPTTASAAANKPSASGATTFGKADLDKIFPPGRGQDLVFRACVNCHNWVPLVLADFDPPAWEQNLKNHRERVSGLNDEEFNALYSYLKGNFYLGKPVPTNIPKDLLDSWTSY